MVSFNNKPAIDTKRIQRFHQAKKEYLPFFSAILWKLTNRRDLFREAMQHALYGLWQQLDKITSQNEPGMLLYEIALNANQHAWSQTFESEEAEPFEGHHLSRLFSGRSRLPQRVRFAISQLDSFQASLIVLRYVERKPASVIAAWLNCEASHVESGMSQALAELKRRLRIHIKSYLALHGLASELADLELIAV
jgi:DNA-directed RNA polymerase specialized sigma24 family protein